MILSDGTSNVTPDATIADDEQRFLAAVVSTLEDAQAFLSLAADARERRGVGVEDLEMAQDELLAVRADYARAVDRRKRELRILSGDGCRGRK